MTDYSPSASRYERSPAWFRRCGRSGLLLPAISLGMWHNFGAPGTEAVRFSDESSMHENCRRMCFAAFDHGITHFDLANNYGPPPGSAEERMGRILREDFRGHRDELIISTKAGYRMWPGPYGEWGSRKYLIASLDQSLKRLGLDYVDIFYHHRPDPIPGAGGSGGRLEETMAALDQLVRSGKALYAGISSYSGALTAEAAQTCEANGFYRPVIHQPSYSMLQRWVEKDLLPHTWRLGMGVIAFCPLAQGQLTGKYLQGVPTDSRAASGSPFLKAEQFSEAHLQRLRKLNEVAQERGQSLAQMALAWTLRNDSVTSALIGASRPEQIIENVKAVDGPPFTEDELARIDGILAA